MHASFSPHWDEQIVCNYINFLLTEYKCIYFQSCGHFSTLLSLIIKYIHIAIGIHYTFVFIKWLMGKFISNIISTINFTTCWIWNNCQRCIQNVVELPMQFFLKIYLLSLFHHHTFFLCMYKNVHTFCTCIVHIYIYTDHEWMEIF